jgi:protein-disulfide isomerase
LLELNPGEVKLVIKHFPNPENKIAMMASKAALAAHEQDRFWEYHEKLFENNDSLSKEKIEKIALDLDLDFAKFQGDMKSPAITGLINRNIEDGLAADVSGIPAVFINGKIIEDQSFETLQREVEAALVSKVMKAPESDSTKP